MKKLLRISILIFFREFQSFEFVWKMIVKIIFKLSSLNVLIKRLNIGIDFSQVLLRSNFRIKENLNFFIKKKLEYLTWSSLRNKSNVVSRVTSSWQSWNQFPSVRWDAGLASTFANKLGNSRRPRIYTICNTSTVTSTGCFLKICSPFSLPLFATFSLSQYHASVHIPRLSPSLPDTRLDRGQV